MAHLVDGILTAPVIVGATLLTAGGVAMGLRRLEADHLPKAALLGSAFFVASLVHVPIGPSSAHLLLNGTIGLLLGWRAFPVILVGILLQAVLFGYGGLTVAGVNTLVMAGPAVAVHLLLCPWVRRAPPPSYALLGGLAGAGGIALTAASVGLALALSGREFLPAAGAVFLAHLPIMVVEALLAGAVLQLLGTVRPDLIIPRPGIARGA
ncbi:MAG: cobalt transporter CbiM [Magnetospirillum sp. WYHS-4]